MEPDNVNNNLEKENQQRDSVDQENELARQRKVICDRHMTFSDVKIRKLDMEFDSEEVAYQFYKAYSRECGFGIRRHDSHRDRNKKILDRTFCCACQGERQGDKRDVKTRAPRPETRTNCHAYMKVNACYYGKYKVLEFNPYHSGHELVHPSEVHLLRCHRNINSIQAAQLDDIQKAGITPKAGLDYISEQVGGRENVGFTLQDIRNYLRTKITVHMKQGEAGVVLSYLESKHTEDPNFFSAVQLDLADQITNIFWADGQMMADYLHFGDVVSFDTTYKKNDDGRPLALFVGVNHHKQTTVFGAALLYDETSASFLWLSETFAKAMSGKLPTTIVTDQDPAMEKALKDSDNWKNVFHRLCIWHIYQNAAIHLRDTFSKFPKFTKDFSSCIYYYEEEEDFLDAWNKMLIKYDLQGNEWLEKLLGKKEKWALVYGRQKFCADITTTQRSESMHSALKRYVNYKFDLSQFFQHFGRLIDDSRYEEKKAGVRTSKSKPQLSFPIQLLIHACSIYTHEVFKLFQTELSKAIDAKSELIDTSGLQYKYIVRLLNHQHYHIVTYYPSDIKVSCSCRKFEFSGILCSHALKVLHSHEILRIPEPYILKRWTKKAKKGVVEFPSQSSGTLRSSNEEENEKIRIGERYRELCRLDTQRTTKAALTQETFEFARNNAHKEIEEIDSMLEQLALAKPIPVSHSVPDRIVVSKVTEKQTVTPRSAEIHIHEPSHNMESTSKEVEIAADEITIKGWKKKEKKVKSGKGLKSGLEQATGKRKTRKKSSAMSLKNKGQNICDNNGNPSSASVFQPPSCQTLSSFPQIPQSYSSLLSTTILQPPSCPLVPSFSQLSQNYSSALPNLDSVRTPMEIPNYEGEHPIPLIPTSQLIALMKPNDHHNLSCLPQYVGKDQSTSMSMMGLLQAQMQNP